MQTQTHQLDPNAHLKEKQFNVENGSFIVFNASSILFPPNAPHQTMRQTFLN